MLRSVEKTIGGCEEVANSYELDEFEDEPLMRAWDDA